MSDDADLLKLAAATRPHDPKDAPHYPFNPPLPFAEDALEPLMSAATVRVQRAMHQQYARLLNAALERHPHLQGVSVESIVRRAGELPALERALIHDAAAGHANHQFFWKILKPGGNGGAGPEGRLAAHIARDFGSVEELKRRFNAMALGLPGPGWAYLSVDPANGALALDALAGNGSIMDLGKPGVMICDMWEHAYLLDHGPDRAGWLDAFWQLVDWEVIGKRLELFYGGGTHA
ncbi:MAG: hypothetical protein A4S12_02290 [Proteobacteria bacterium SG_bin5]|nr:superoxide dismutase [Sphingomonas sp.]OQW39399.1 MAG: hypothetical protein A4S12_02290 [Proteobacteria bacterium SG_bin5]